MAAKLNRSHEHKTFSDIARLFAERKAALKYFCVPGHVYFSRYSEKELQERLSYHLQEAEYDASLALLAAMEAAFRLDFDYRQKKRLKDTRSREVRRLSGSPRGEFNYEISINALLNTLKLDPFVSDRIITLLKNCFKYRNWLAHGRYWHLNIGADKPAFSDIYQLALAIEDRLYR